MTKLTRILEYSYDNADFRNFLCQTWGKVMINLRETYDHN